MHVRISRYDFVGLNFPLPSLKAIASFLQDKGEADKKKCSVSLAIGKILIKEGNAVISVNQRCTSDDSFRAFAIVVRLRVWLFLKVSKVVLKIKIDIEYS